MQTFLEAYIECALWSSTDNSRDDGGDPLDDNYGPDDIAPEALASMQADCEAFYQADQALIDAHMSPAQAGHDFWLTRNRHGAGFWDRGLPDNVGRALTDAAHSYGSSDLYIGDDGQVYCD